MCSAEIRVFNCVSSVDESPCVFNSNLCVFQLFLCVGEFIPIFSRMYIHYNNNNNNNTVMPCFWLHAPERKSLI